VSPLTRATELTRTGVVHCVGLLLDSQSGLGRFNRLISGSGSVPDGTYDEVTRTTAENAVEELESYLSASTSKVTFLFVSAAESNWPQVRGGKFVERYLAPKWLRRYLAAKRSVEKRLEETSKKIRTVVFRPSLVYTLDDRSTWSSLPPVGAFFVGNKVGLPFVDRPVTVQRLSLAMVRALGDDAVQGVLGYKEIDTLAR